MTVAADLLLAWSAAYASVAAWGVGRVDRAAPRALRSASSSARVLLVRPCAGEEPELAGALRSSAALGVTSIRFAIAGDDDAAAPTVRAVCAELRARGLDASVVVTSARGANRKAEQLAAVLRDAPPHDVVVVADSDVRLAPTDVDVLLAPFDDPRVAACWSPPVPSAHALTAGDRLMSAVLGATLHAFPILARLDSGGFVGKLFAVRREALRAVGSFDALASSLGEDVELGRRLRAMGSRVACVGIARTCPRALRSIAVVDRLTRWFHVVRAQRPWLLASYPLLFFPALPAALASLALGETAGYVAAALFLVARIALALGGLPGRARSASRRFDVTALAWAFAADAAIAIAFLRALASRRVRWRGTALRLDRGAVALEEP